MKLVVRWGLVAVLCWVLALPAHARRLALVIGNNDYQNVEKLRNARNDATAMAQALTAAGFAVTREADLGRDAMFKVLDRFVTEIARDDEVVFYFAGHGVQIDAAPYLLPVDIRADSARQLTRDAVSLDSVLGDLGKARYGLVVVDACRDNPFASRGLRSLAERGLQPIEPPEGTAVILSAGRGQKALDSLGAADKDPNGVFTRELLKQMAIPGVNVRDLLLRVRDMVEQRAASVSHKQRPALIDESRGQFYFHAPAQPVVARAAMPDATLVEIAYWNSVQERGGAEELQLYLRRYPQGQFADLARVRLARLQAPAPVAAGASSGQAASSPASAPASPARGNAEARRSLELAEKGNLPAMANVAGWYQNGRNGLPRDAEAARRWYEKAAQGGNAAGIGGLGYLHEKGLAGLPKDPRKAVELYRQAAALGDARAMNNLGAALATGIGGARDEVEAVAWYRQSALAGHARAMANLGYMQERGRGGLVRDEKQALEWYRKGAESGDGRAMSQLGLMHLYGRGGLPRDPALAVDLYRKGADIGDASAMMNLGAAYALARGGLPRDDVQALHWYQQAVDMGSVRALAEIGYFHQQGRGGLAKDEARALELYRRCADQGDPLGMNYLAGMLANGRAGLARDDAQALTLYRAAAEEGEWLAMNNLGVFHRDGRGGLPRDEAQARTWFDRAAALGHEPARRNLQAPR